MNAIRTIAVPTATEFLEYVRRREPVVVRGLFAGQEIAQLTTVDKMVDAFGDCTIPITDQSTLNVLAHVGSASPGSPPEEVTIREYLGRIASDPETKRMAVEAPTPQPLMATYEPPPYSDGAAPVRTLFFVGNKGNTAHLHHDRDFRQVLLYQICGVKRVILFPVESAPRLLPVVHNSCFYLENLKPNELSGFVEYAGGAVCTLEPGDALFMPALVWHYVEYTSVGMSLSLRFDVAPEGRLFREQFGHHMTSAMQLVASRIVAGGGSPEHARAIEALHEVQRQPHDDPFKRYLAMEAALRRLVPEAERLVLWDKWREKAETEQELAALHFEARRHGVKLSKYEEGLAPLVIA